MADYYTVTCPDGFAFTAPDGTQDLETAEIRARMRDLQQRIIQMGTTVDPFASEIATLVADVTQLTSEVAGVTAIQTAYNNLVTQNQADVTQLTQVNTSFANALAEINTAITTGTPSAGTGAAPVTLPQLQAGAAAAASSAGTGAAPAPAGTTTSAGTGSAGLTTSGTAGAPIGAAGTSASASADDTSGS